MGPRSRTLTAPLGPFSVDVTEVMLRVGIGLCVNGIVVAGIRMPDDGHRVVKQGGIERL